MNTLYFSTNSKKLYTMTSDKQSPITDYKHIIERNLVQSSTSEYQLTVFLLTTVLAKYIAPLTTKTTT